MYSMNTPRTKPSIAVKYSHTSSNWLTGQTLMTSSKVCWLSLWCHQTILMNRWSFTFSLAPFGIFCVSWSNILESPFSLEDAREKFGIVDGSAKSNTKGRFKWTGFRKITEKKFNTKSLWGFWFKKIVD